MSTPFKKKTPASNADCFARCYHKGGKYYCYNFSRVSVEFFADYWLMSPGVSV